MKKKIKIEVTEPAHLPVDRLEQLDGVKQVALEGSNVTIISKVGSGNLDRAISIIKENGGLLGIQAEKPNLEDVFLTLTGKQLRDGEEKEE